MQPIEYRVRLDATRPGSQAQIYVKKGDVMTRRIIIQLVNGSEPFPIEEAAEVTLRGVKPDDTLVYAGCEISGNLIVHTITPQMMAVAGRVNCELNVYDEGGLLLTSPGFDVYVQNTLYDDLVVESSDDFSALTDAILAEHARAEAEEEREAAEEERQALFDEFRTAYETGQLTGPEGPAGPVGPPGPQGSQGERGLPGPAGSTGATGERGPQGVTFRPAMSGTVLSWTNDGGLQNPGKVDLKGPKGDQGERGIQGVQGITGSKGDPGQKGDQGERGPRGYTFTPKMSGGVLTWSNDGGLSNPSSVNLTGPAGPVGPEGPKGDTGSQGPRGETGPQGPAGQSFSIMGYYASISALQGAIPNPSAGDAYGIGAAAPYDIYIFDGNSKSWVNNGSIQGPEGPKGDPGQPGSDGEHGPRGYTFTPAMSGGMLSWSNDGGLANPGSVDLTGPRGPAGEQGIQGEPGGKGDQGDRGPRGYTFTPKMSGSVLSWSNDGNLTNPGSVDLKGPKGDTGDRGPAGNDGQPGGTGPQGDRGPQGYTFTPHVADYVVTWTNDGGLANPDQTDLKVPVAQHAADTTLHTNAEERSYWNSKANGNHDQAASTITAGTLAGRVNANTTAMAALSTAQVRDVVLTTSDPGEGASVSYPDGTVILVYE